jgi:hypothetical protein
MIVHLDSYKNQCKRLSLCENKSFLDNAQFINSGKTKTKIFRTLSSIQKYFYSLNSYY